MISCHQLINTMPYFMNTCTVRYTYGTHVLIRIIVIFSSYTYVVCVFIHYMLTVNSRIQRPNETLPYNNTSVLVEIIVYCEIPYYGSTSQEQAPTQHHQEE